ncbi:hypothetical protein [Thalassoroseus pseudoceratinae]|uniref:hypothetical protein n=1 Tax=Thalassoroseus pseudoceratinae TaxID=2713176 RepID=UPI0014211DA4|nr:hypothetical protein [Thalassoroseus pseudoceratinae]
MLHEILGWFRSNVLSDPAHAVIAVLCLLGLTSVLTVMLKERSFRLPSFRMSASTFLWLSPVLALLAVLGTRLFPFFAPTTAAERPDAATQLPWEEDPVWHVHPVETWGPIEELELAHVQKRTEDGRVSWRLVLESEQHTTTEDARNELKETVVALVSTDLQRVYPEIVNPVISEHDIRKECVLNETLMTTEHELPDSGRTFETKQLRWVVELNPEIRKHIRSTWEKELVSARAGLVAGTFGFVTFLFGLLATYLRVDSRTNGNYRGRLKLGLLSLAIAGGLGFLKVLNVIATDSVQGLHF